MQGTVVEIPTTDSVSDSVASIGTNPAAENSASPWGKPATSPWGTTKSAIPVSPCNLSDVMSDQMSEDLANKLQTEEDFWKDSIKIPETSAGIASEILPDDADSDLILAQMLQSQYDQEHDELLRREEQKYNGPSKVKLTFNNYRVAQPELEEDDLNEEEELYSEEENEEEEPVFRRGVSGKGSAMISKHDLTLSGRRNVKKMENFPPGFETGDSGSFDMQLSNKVYNSLKQHSESDNKRKFRLHEKKEHSTAEMAVDEKTRLILYKMMNNELLDEVHGIISTGKESVVIHAQGGRNNEVLVPREVAIKVFKTTLADFKTRAQYVQGDMRFFKDEFKKQNPRRIMKIWADKERFNLQRLTKYGVPVPRVVLLKKHLLVLSFIGRDQQAAPKLKDANLNTVDMQMAYEQCISGMHKMYRDAGLVHADLSEYNMLWHDDTLYFIDVSQAVEAVHPRAMKFLYRDCCNVCQFFQKAGIPNVPKPHELFNELTELNLRWDGSENTFLAQVEEYEKNEEKLRSDKGKDYPFEYFFQKATLEREEKGEDSSSDDSEEETNPRSHNHKAHKGQKKQNQRPKSPKSPKRRPKSPKS